MAWNNSLERESLGDSMGSPNVQSKFDYPDLNPQSEEENLTLIGITAPANITEQPYVRDEFLAKIEQSVLVLIFTLTLFGNFLVLVGIYFRKQKMTRMYYFIIHLSIADLTTAFFNVLTQLFWEITYRFQGGPLMCKFVKYTQILGPYSSSYILVMTALDRYQAICYPLSNCSWTARRSKVMLGAAWVFSFLCCLPQLYIFNYQEIKPGSGEFDCWGTFIPNWGEKAYITWYCITVFIIPLAILIFAYTCITRVIWLNFSMKNAIIKEERPKRGLSRGDSEDVDEQGFDQSIEDTEIGSKILTKFDKPKGTENGKFYRKTFSARRAEEKFTEPKHLEVSWHNRNQDNQITTSFMSPTADLPVSLMKCHSYPSPGSKDININNSPNSSYYEDKKEQYLSTINPHEDNKDALKSKQCISPNVNGSIQVSDKPMPTPEDEEGKSFLTERPRWKSISTSTKYNTSRHEEASKERHEEVNGDYGGRNRSLKSLKISLLSPTNEKTHKVSTKNMSRSISVKSTALSHHSQPRTHSVKGISRAKIKTIKLTVTVISMYICCSTPFIAALLWSAFDPYAKEHPFFFGPTFTILTLLASLNSCANAWIVLFFNPNLLQSFVQGICGRNPCPRQHIGRPLSMTNSQRKQPYNKSMLVTTNSNQMTATSVTGLSPLMNRLSDKPTSNRSPKDHDLMELIPSPASGSNSRSMSTKSSKNYPTDRKSRDATIPIETSFIGI